MGTTEMGDAFDRTASIALTFRWRCIRLQRAIHRK